MGTREKKRILVIDDDPDFLDYISIVLSSNGYEVLTASNVEDGLAKMRTLLPNLVIADVMLSYSLEGWTISREMFSDPRLRKIPLLMVSAIVSKEDVGLFPSEEEGRVDAFLRKPVDPSTLLERISELLGNTSQAKEE
ncbi:MAG: response regulator [Anaerolineae bacterium]|nr:response regulator [Anaerolineae bacterium]